MHNNFAIPSSLYETCLQGINVVVCNMTNVWPFSVQSLLVINYFMYKDLENHVFSSVEEIFYKTHE